MKITLKKLFLFGLMLVLTLSVVACGKKDETDVAHFNIDAMCNTRPGPNINRSGPQFPPI